MSAEKLRESCVQAQDEGARQMALASRDRRRIFGQESITDQRIPNLPQGRSTVSQKYIHRRRIHSRRYAPGERPHFGELRNSLLESCDWRSLPLQSRVSDCQSPIFTAQMTRCAPVGMAEPRFSDTSTGQSLRCPTVSYTPASSLWAHRASNRGSAVVDGVDAATCRLTSRDLPPVAPGAQICNGRHAKALVLLCNEESGC